MNQAWAGAPGSQILSGLGTNKQVEVWTKPLGKGRTAALFVNTASENMEFASSSGNGGALKMNPCDAQSKSQVWSLSPGASWNNSQVTNMKGLASGGCWEITGCRP